MRTGRERVTSVLRAAFAQLLLAQRYVRRTPPKTLFVLGHMRSGSSLLMHILGTHPELRALGESWLQYDGPDKLKQLLVLVHTAQRRPFVTEKYVVDKILHDELLEAEHLLRRPDVLALFLVREPERSLLSMMSHRERLKDVSDWESALRHYQGRLERLVSQARIIADPRRALLVRYEQLIGDAAPCLESIRAFLGLRAPLSDRYRVTRFTGVAGLGDFSEHIKSGKIVRTRPAEDLRVPADVLARATKAHEACLAALSASIRTV